MAINLFPSASMSCHGRLLTSLVTGKQNDSNKCFLNDMFALKETAECGAGMKVPHMLSCNYRSRDCILRGISGN